MKIISINNIFVAEGANSSSSRSKRGWTLQSRNSVNCVWKNVFHCCVYEATFGKLESAIRPYLCNGSEGKEYDTKQQQQHPYLARKLGKIALIYWWHIVGSFRAAKSPLGWL